MAATNRHLRRNVVVNSAPANRSQQNNTMPSQGEKLRIAHRRLSPAPRHNDKVGADRPSSRRRQPVRPDSIPDARTKAPREHPSPQENAAARSNENELMQLRCKLRLKEQELERQRESMERRVELTEQQLQSHQVLSLMLSFFIYIINSVQTATGSARRIN